MPDDGRKKSRLASFRALDDNHPKLQLPDIESEHGASYLISLLQEAGLMSSNGMGPVPLSWVDIESWTRCTEYDLPLWVKLTIKHLSEEYVHELLEAKDMNRPAPYEAVPVIEDEVDLAVQREKVQNKLLDFASRFKRKAPPDDPVKEDSE